MRNFEKDITLGSGSHPIFCLILIPFQHAALQEGIFFVYLEEYMTGVLSLLSGLKCKACRL